MQDSDEPVGEPPEGVVVLDPAAWTWAGVTPATVTLPQPPPDQGPAGTAERPRVAGRAEPGVTGEEASTLAGGIPRAVPGRAACAPAPIHARLPQRTARPCDRSGGSPSAPNPRRAVRPHPARSGRPTGPGPQAGAHGAPWPGGPKTVEPSSGRSPGPFVSSRSRGRVECWGEGATRGRLTAERPTAGSTGKEFDMTISEQVDALQAKVAELKSSLEASRHETNEQIKARAAEAKAKADAAHKAASERAQQMGDQARAQRQSFQAGMSARMQELQARMNRKRDEHDVKAAEREAEAAEDDAADALDYASWAVEQAEVEVLYAADARLWANARAAESPAS